MTVPLRRAVKDWLIAPPDEHGAAGGEPGAHDQPTAPAAGTGPERPRRWLEPVPPPTAGADPRPRQRFRGSAPAAARDEDAHNAERFRGSAPAAARDEDAHAAERFRGSAPTVGGGGDALSAAVEPVGIRVAVLGDPGDVPAVAAGVALALRRRRRSGAALVLLWPWRDGDDDRDAAAGFIAAGVPALPGARLLAARLARHSLRARAHGRLAWLPLPGDRESPARPGAAGVVEDARLLALRAETVAANAPTVVAVMAPRDAHVDAMLADCGLAIVAAEPGSALAEPAVAELAELGLDTRAIAPPPPGAARIAALAGLRPLPVEDERSVT